MHRFNSSLPSCQGGVVDLATGVGSSVDAGRISQSAKTPSVRSTGHLPLAGEKKRISNKVRILVASLFLMLMGFSSPTSAQAPGAERVGTSAAAFLKIGIGPRAAALAESFIALADDPTAAYWNPAGLTQLRRPDLFFSHNRYLVDLNQENFIAVIPIGVADAVALFVNVLHTPEFQETTVYQPYGTGRSVKYSDQLFGASYARQMTDRFSFGVTTKYLIETLDHYKMKSVLFDLGSLYWTGFSSTRISVAFNHFAPNDLETDGSYTIHGQSRNFQSFAAPQVFRVGLAWDPVDSPIHKLTTSAQLSHPNDNAEFYHLGAEYTFQGMIAGRIGYRFTEEENNFSTGMGVRIPISGMAIHADASWSEYGDLGNVLRYSLRMEL